MHTTALVRLGELSLAEGRRNEARTNFERVLEVAQEEPGALTNNPAAARLGLLRLDLDGSPSAAVVERARILLTDIERSKGRHDMPDEAAAAYMLHGLALLRTGDVIAARAPLDTAVKMRESMDAPQSVWLAEARLYLAGAHLASGDLAGARRLVALAEEAHRTQGRVGPQYTRLLAESRAALAR
jgi:serine/threonine-protein kinase